ncbi:hypothetical protein HY256_10700 [Candidatus Sumerlaeota bacterium]|nr:hypothetical protein [Candidatus Sumerlaeota bacterium]
MSEYPERKSRSIKLYVAFGLAMMLFAVLTRFMMPRSPERRKELTADDAVSPATKKVSPPNKILASLQTPTNTESAASASPSVSPMPLEAATKEAVTTPTSNISSIPSELCPFKLLPPERAPKEEVDWFKRVQAERPELVGYEVYDTDLSKLFKGKNPRDLQVGNTIVLNLPDHDGVELVITEAHLNEHIGVMDITARGIKDKSDGATFGFDLSKGRSIGHMYINGQYREAHVGEPFSMFFITDPKKALSSSEFLRRRRRPTETPVLLSDATERNSFTQNPSAPPEPASGSSLPIPAWFPFNEGYFSELNPNLKFCSPP